MKASMSRMPETDSARLSNAGSSNRISCYLTSHFRVWTDLKYVGSWRKKKRERPSSCSPRAPKGKTKSKGSSLEQTTTSQNHLRWMNCWLEPLDFVLPFGTRGE